MTDTLILKRATFWISVTALAFVLACSSPGCVEDPRWFYDGIGEAESSTISAPQWTPDGSRILLDYSAMIHIVESDGSRVTSIRHQEEGEPDEIFGLTISPDGTRIAYTSADHNSYTFQVITSRLYGTDRRELTKKKKERPGDISPAWSPDGSRIALVSESHIVTMDPDGSDVQTVLECDVGLPCASGNPPVWSPDGQRIAFRGGYGGQYGGHLFVVTTDGMWLAHLMDGLPVGQPAWSPDGKRIAFSRTERVDENRATKLYTVIANGSDPVEVADLGNYPRVDNLSWSADGTEIRSGTYPFMIVKADGSDHRKFIGLEAREAYASWSPDESRVAVYIRRGYKDTEEIVLFTMAPDGSDMRILAWYREALRSEGNLLEAGHAEPWSPNFRWETVTTSESSAQETSTIAQIQGESRVPPCNDSGMESPNCSPRDVSEYTLFSGNVGGGAFENDEAASVEEVLEKGLHSVGASPVHLVLRGTGSENSVRCDWRGVARTSAQREEAIRFWLELDDDEPIPSATEVERRFMAELDHP